jgi:hypothetical protein
MDKRPQPDPALGHPRRRSRRAVAWSFASRPRYLRPLLGERLHWTTCGSVGPAALAPQQHHRSTTAGQILGPGTHPPFRRRRDLPQPGHRAAPRSTVTNCTTLTPSGERDTLHRQPSQSEQMRRITTTVIHGPRLSPCCEPPLRRDPGSHRAGEDEGVLCVEDWAEIRRLYRAEKMPIKVIARVLGCSKNTVKAALVADGPPGCAPLAK